MPGVVREALGDDNRDRRNKVARRSALQLPDAVTIDLPDIGEAKLTFDASGHLCNEKY